jgi:hypothetical protein
VIGRIGPIQFLSSGIIAVVVFFVYMRALARLGHERYAGARRQIAIGMIVITALLNAAYFLRVLPPLPLVLTDAGIYHGVTRDKRTNTITVQVEEEPPEWQALFGSHPILHVQPSAKLYLYNAVFAPRGLHTVIVHDWQWMSPGKGWQSQQRVRVPISGGREDGFRYYTTKTAPRPGQWQVNIQTFDGRTIGHVRFAVEQQAVPPALTPEVLK